MHVIQLRTIDSTNTYAKQHVDEFPKHQITCISADEQTAGRGRFQNSWISPPGFNLYVTFYFQLPHTTPHITCLAQLLAVSFARILQEEGVHPQIKWPNDVLLNHKKIAGILCETTFQETAIDLFLGIGVNVNMQLADLAKIGAPATSLQVETGKSWDRKYLLQKLQRQLECDLSLFRKEGLAPFHSFLEAHLAYRGETVRCFDGKQEWIGICHSVTAEGKLNLLLPDGTLHAMLSGEMHLRKVE